MCTSPRGSLLCVLGVASDISGEDQAVWLDSVGQRVEPPCPRIVVLELIHAQHAEHVQRLQLTVNGGPWLVQRLTDFDRRTARVPSQVVNDRQPQRWHGVPSTTDGQAECVHAVDTDGNSAADHLFLRAVFRTLWPPPCNTVQLEIARCPLLSASDKLLTGHHP